jgi:hypothetical protein
VDGTGQRTAGQPPMPPRYTSMGCVRPRAHPESPSPPESLWRPFLQRVKVSPSPPTRRRRTPVWAASSTNLQSSVERLAAAGLRD